MLQPTILQGVESVQTLCPGHIFSDSLEYSPSENTSFWDTHLASLVGKREEFDSQLSSLRKETPFKMPLPH